MSEKDRKRAYAHWLIVCNSLRLLYSEVVVHDLPPGAQALFNHLSRADALDGDEDVPGLHMFLADERRREEIEALTVVTSRK